MNKKLKSALIAVVSLITLALLMHLTNTYLFPFISNMHSNGGY